MPKQKSKSKSKKLVIQGINQEIQDPNDVEEFIREASEVKQMTQHAGWGILERDVHQYRHELIRKLAYINPRRKEFDEIRILFLASDKLLSMVNDYQENRDLALAWMKRIENPKFSVSLDVDNEIPIKQGSSIDGY